PPRLARSARRPAPAGAAERRRADPRRRRGGGSGGRAVARRRHAPAARLPPLRAPRRDTPSPLLDRPLPPRRPRLLLPRDARLGLRHVGCPPRGARSGARAALARRRPRRRARRLRRPRRGRAGRLLHLLGFEGPGGNFAVLTPRMLAPAGAFRLAWGAAAARGRRPAAALVACALFAPGLGFVLLRPLGEWAETRSSRDLATYIEPGVKSAQ